MDIRALRFDVGDPICGWGRLVRNADGDWLDPLGKGRASRPSEPKPLRASRYGVRVEHADFDALQDRVVVEEAVAGYATVYGQWRGNHIAIHRQTQGRPGRHYQLWSVPPCPPPPRGWPHGMNGRNRDNLDYDLGDLQETGAAVAVTIFRPSHDQAVLVVAATDIEEVQRQLGPQLPDRLCVIPSRWTIGQLEDARDHLRAMRELWGIFMIGCSNDEEGQPFVLVSPVRVIDDIADWITSQPDGLIQVRPWLAPFPPKT